MNCCNQNVQGYEYIKKYINEGDILLFRGKGILSKFVKASLETPYSHVAIASWINGQANTNHGILECVEFREGSIISGLLGLRNAGGGRSVNLYQEIKKHNGLIDVYRPDPIFFDLIFDAKEKKIIIKEKKYDGKKVTTTMRKMTGLPYGWKRIWWMFKHKLWIWKMLHNTDNLICDISEEIIYPVCSSALSYSCSVNGYDITKNRSDEWMEPGNFATSSSLNYLFTLTI